MLIIGSDRTETAPRFGDIIGDHHIEIFLAHFLLRVGRQIFSFRGKADERFAFFVLTKFSENVRVRFQPQLDRALAAIHFLLGN